MCVCKGRNWNQRGSNFFRTLGSAASLLGRPSNAFITETVLVVWLIEEKLPDQTTKKKNLTKTEWSAVTFQKMEQKKLLQQNSLYGLLCNWIAFFQKMTVNWHDQDQMLQEKQNSHIFGQLCNTVWYGENYLHNLIWGSTCVLRTDSSYKVYFSLAQQMLMLLIQMLTQHVLAQK